jgi:ABC-type enterochelin transport system permease subunit
MNSLTQVMPVGSTVSKGAILKRLFVIGYLTAVAVAMVGWVSAFGWITVRVAKWLLA